MTMQLSSSQTTGVIRYAKIFAVIGVLLGLHVYLGFAIKHNFKKTLFLIFLFCVAYIYFFYYLFINQFPNFGEKKFGRLKDYCNTQLSREWRGVRILPLTFKVLPILIFFAWIIYDSWGSPIRLRSFLAIIVYILISVIVSANPAKIKWRPVIGGFVLQFCVGLIVLRWSSGHKALQWISEKVVGFLDYTKAGTDFTYGFISKPPNICGSGGAFLYTSLQIIIYFGAVVAVLYYFGIIEMVLSRIAVVMQYTVGTTAAESLNAAACIFLGQTEAAILIEPALETMTESEIHAVMTAGFACIAGSLFSAYISFGACPAYLLSATVMSASVSLAVSKMIYPEIQVSRQKSMHDFKFKSKANTTLIGCISDGAVHSARFIGDIGANLIVYLAYLSFCNDGIQYMGSLVGYPNVTFNQLLGYCFFPLAYVMGASDAKDSEVNISETFKVAELMGMKTILNEFIAYQRLAEMIKDGTLKGARAQMIATYALCGFSNISMIGSQLGILGSMCPHRKGIFAKVVVRALVAGCISCFLTASVAGVLVDTPLSCKPTANSHCLDVNTLIPNTTMLLSTTTMFS